MSLDFNMGYFEYYSEMSKLKLGVAIFASFLPFPFGQCESGNYEHPILWAGPKGIIVLAYGHIKRGLISKLL